MSLRTAKQSNSTAKRERERERRFWLKTRPRQPLRYVVSPRRCMPLPASSASPLEPGPHGVGRPGSRGARMLPHCGTGEDHAAQGVHRARVRGRRRQDAVLPQPPALPRGDVDTKGVRCEAEGREGGFVQMAGSPCMPTTLDGPGV